MIAYLFRSALSRHPTRTELADFARHFQGMDRASDQMEVLEDEVGNAYLHSIPPLLGRPS